MLKDIQNKVGVVPDGAFGPMTANAIKNHYKLSDIHASHLLGQCAYESNGFKVFEENLNYSTSRIREIFGKYFNNNENVGFYANNPRALASRVYGNRMGNGDEESAEGWTYRGRGALQLTGKRNYSEFAKYIDNLDVFCNPDLVSGEYNIESALFYFRTNRILDYCKDLSTDTITRVSKHVNLGNPDSRATPHGLTQRIDWTNKIFNWLK